VPSADGRYARRPVYGDMDGEDGLDAEATTATTASADAPASTVAPARVQEIERLLDEVDAALQRLDEGTYGTCTSCGRPIDDATLTRSPVTTSCAACSGVTES